MIVTTQRDDVMVMRTVSVAERRNRLARRHLLTEPTDAGVAEVATALTGIHATDPASLVIGTALRMTGGSPESVEHAMYVDRSVLRMLGMRRTMFVVPVTMAPAVQAGATEMIIGPEWRRLAGWIADAGITDDPDAWYQSMTDEVTQTLDTIGSATTKELQVHVPGLRRPLLLDRGKRTEVQVSAASRVLWLMGSQGRIGRGRPLGTWIGTQHRWEPITAWLPHGMPPMDRDAAQAALARHWLRSYGPGTRDDLRWWAKWTVADTAKALVAVDAVEVDLDGVTGYLLPDDVDPEPEAPSWAALLPALDSTPMAWKHRDWFLGEHRAALFDRNGNIGPTIWVDGRIVGGWTQRRNGDIVVELLEDPGTDAMARIDAAADRVRQIVGDIRFVPRFRTPLEQTLSKA